jgi:hypothetical protein
MLKFIKQNKTILYYANSVLTIIYLLFFTNNSIHCNIQKDLFAHFPVGVNVVLIVIYLIWSIYLLLP